MEAVVDAHLKQPIVGQLNQLLPSHRMHAKQIDIGPIRRAQCLQTDLRHAPRLDASPSFDSSPGDVNSGCIQHNDDT